MHAGMKRILLLVAALASFAACAPIGSNTRVTGETLSVPSAQTFIPLDDRFNDRGYLIDGLSQTCTLLYQPEHIGQQPMVAIPVDCAILAANSKPLAAVITWLQPAPAPAAQP
jgi:hypothetical protein